MNLRTDSLRNPWRTLSLVLLLLFSVQGLSLVPLLSHWSCAEHCESTTDCHSDGEGEADGCDPSCSCLGCPAHTGGLALLPGMPALLHRTGVQVRLIPQFEGPPLEPVRAVFRPPCA